MSRIFYAGLATDASTKEVINWFASYSDEDQNLILGMLEQFNEPRREGEEMDRFIWRRNLAPKLKSALRTMPEKQSQAARKKRILSSSTYPFKTYRNEKSTEKNQK